MKIELIARTVAFILGIAMLAQLALCGGCFSENNDPDRTIVIEDTSSSSDDGTSEESSESGPAPYVPEMACMQCTICNPIPGHVGECVTDTVCCTDDDPFTDKPLDCCR